MLVARSGVLTGRQVRAADCGEAARGARSGVLTGRQEGAGDCGEAAAVFPRGRQEGAGDCGEAAAVSPRGRRGCAGDCGEVAQRVVFAPRLAGSSVDKRSKLRRHEVIQHGRRPKTGSSLGSLTRPIKAL